MKKQVWKTLHKKAQSAHITVTNLTTLIYRIIYYKNRTPSTIETHKRKSKTNTEKNYW